MTTIPTVTDAELTDLRNEAHNAGDYAQAALCTLALAGGSALDTDDREALLSADVDPDDTHPEMARELCAIALDEARAAGWKVTR